VTVLRLEGLTKTFQHAGTVVDAIDLQINHGEFFTLLGPSGCGKSTTLRMVAGFEEPTRGHIFFGDRDVTFDPPNRRGIGMVFQNYALFPHLSVAQNVAFGLRVRSLPAKEIQERVAAALEQVQLKDAGPSRIDQLSGGQQQRVALARALVIRPALLLLDEPLSNLDAKLREETRSALRSLHSSTSVTTVYVTHDQAEAMAMSGRIAVMNRGKVHQVATPEEIYERPATRFVATFIGRNNILDGVVVTASERSVVIRFADGRSEITVDPRRRAPDVEINPGSRVGVCLRAESLRFTSENGTFAGVVTDVEYSGSAFSCVVRTGVGDLRVEAPSDLGRPSTGEPVRLAVNHAAVHMVGPA
jgi:iron(III) transport system ATP-binding protein